MRINNSWIRNLKQLIKPTYFEFLDFFNFKSKKLLQKNQILKNKHQGKRCFLLLTGASIDQINLEQLKNEYTMGVNLLYLHKDIDKVNLNAHFMSSNYILLNKNIAMTKRYARFVSNKNLNPYYKNKLLSIYRKCKERSLNIFNLIDASLGDETIIFAESINYSFLKRHSIFLNKSVYYYKHMDRISTYKNDCSFYDIDYTKRNKGGGSAFSNAILLLIYMGFTDIYLCGEGYSCDPIYEFHFYDNFTFSKTLGIPEATKQAKSLIEQRNVELGHDLQLFSLLEKESSYNPIYTRDYEPISTTFSVNSYLDSLARSKGVKINNIVPEGFEGKIFRTISWKDVLKIIKN